MFSTEFYSKFDPSYRKALRKLESKLQHLKWNQGQHALIDFAGKHMVPQELWNKYRPQFPNWFKSAAQHIFLYKNIPEYNPDNKYYDNEYEYNITVLDIRHLTYPHKDLDKRLRIYEKQIYSFIPPKIRQRHEEMKTLYSKIKAAEGNLDEWYAALLEADDVHFLRDNVEYKLGTDLTDKILWKKYIDFLKKHDFELLLETYSKYVRFFTDDVEMKDEYRQAADQYGRQIPVPWKNPYSFEVYDDKFWINKAEEFRPQYILPEKEPLTMHFDGSNTSKQKLPFKIDMLEYILDNVNGEVLQKLFKTCKWFHASQPVNVCYKFEDCGHSKNQPVEIKEHSIKSYNNSVLHSNLDYIFISNVFYYSSTNSKALSNLIPKIYRCAAKHVEIWNQHLSLEELKFFIGNAFYLKLENVKDSDGKQFNLETVLQLAPKIKRVHLSAVEYTAETSAKLCELKFQNKIDRICFSNIKINSLDPVKFAEFVKKNCSSKAHVSIWFNMVFEGKKYIDEFCQVLDDAINEKWSEDEKPKLFISYF